MKTFQKICLPLACLSVLSFGAGSLSPQSAAVLSVCDAKAAGQAAARRVSFDRDWKFFLGDADHPERNVFDDAAWRTLDVPHDWSIELPFDRKSPAGSSGGFLNGGVGWYRKTFSLPDVGSRKILIDFDGVYMNSSVYINGHLLGTHPYGYTSFQYDLTPYLNPAGTPNVLAVRVENNQPTSRWYSGSGIERNVWLQTLNPVHVAQWGTFVTTPTPKKTENGWDAMADVQTKVANDAAQTKTVKVISKIYGPDQKLVGTAKQTVVLRAGETLPVKQSVAIPDAALWSVDKPQLYKLETSIVENGTVLDATETPFGVRFFSFDANTGFSLNGVPMKMHGVCLHHDQGSLGAITNVRALTRQLQIMKDMGVNAIRTSHNPPTPELLDLADHMGFLVMDEAFDCWEIKKSTNDYHLYFNDWSDRDLASMVERDKNHPSIVIWGIGNEIPERSLKTAKRLRDDVRAIDTTRPVAMANAGGNYDADVADALDLVGYNYYDYSGITQKQTNEKVYDNDHAKHPNWKIFGSETSSAIRSRGVYHLPTSLVQPDMAHFDQLKTEDQQCSSFDNTVVPWGATAEKSWIDDRDRPFCFGQFIWTGFDYIGEPTPYDTSKSSYFGIVDTCGFPKDIYYFYKSQWTQEPLVHLLPSWEKDRWQAGETVPVWAYTNAKTVELFLNGKSLGIRTYDPKGDTLHFVSTGSTPAETFDIVDAATGASVYTGKLSEQKHDAEAGEELQTADFTDFKTPGTYKLRVGDRLSYDFEIGDNVYALPAAEVWRSYTLMRSGVPIKDPVTGLDVPEGHPQDRHAIVYFTDDNAKKGDQLDMSGGWYDAGDYGKYVPTAAITVAQMLMAYEAHPDHFGEGQMQFPEGVTGEAGMPDALAEAKWELNWMRKMQRLDGSTYVKVAGLLWTGTVRPCDDTQDRYIIGEGTFNDAMYGATLALASRVYKPFSETYSGGLLDDALLAWDYLEKHPTMEFRRDEGQDNGSGNYSTDTDENQRAWLAAELFRTTGDKKYEDYLKGRGREQMTTKTVIYGWGNTQALAQYAYLKSEHADPEFRKEVLAAFIQSADEIVQQIKQDGLRCSLHDWDFYWASTKVAVTNGDLLLLANEFAPNPDYVSCALDQVHYLLGRNALDRSFVTGVGDNPPIHPHNRIMSATGVYIPGVVVGGANKYKGGDPKQTAYLESGNIPSAKAYLDDGASWSTNEYAIDYVAAAAFALSYFSYPQSGLVLPKTDPFPKAQ